jgi:hypothetical protein
MLAGDNPENDAARIEQLLRLGAHAIAGGGEEEQAEDKGMAAEGIDQVGGGHGSTCWGTLSCMVLGVPTHARLPCLLLPGGCDVKIDCACAFQLHECWQVSLSVASVQHHS